jgi:hypothetical protein
MEIRLLAVTMKMVVMLLMLLQLLKWMIRFDSPIEIIVLTTVTIQWSNPWNIITTGDTSSMDGCRCLYQHPSPRHHPLHHHRHHHPLHHHLRNIATQKIDVMDVMVMPDYGVIY